ncbi:hypothetical protein [Clostridium gasigenes]|uniref:Uncharacterized protein n=1 Tax=Clostridium gasigenes TaxID=94869 RepID=A0A1H0VC28_9CLOT|nr:hypothetical protein [Clostridium gasigenes]SDP76129.1 hypothetical protein SAMN04488529_11579 [Clostridium gasigenes]
MLDSFITNNITKKSLKKFAKDLDESDFQNKSNVYDYLSKLVTEKRLTKRTLNEYLFEELFYGQQKDVYVNKIFSLDKDILDVEKLYCIIEKKYGENCDFNKIATTILSNDDPKLELVACKSIINPMTTKVCKIKMIFAYMIKRYDSKKELITEHSYIPVEVDLLKQIVVCKVYPKMNLIKDVYKPESLYEKYIDIIVDMFKLEFNAYNTEHKTSLYNMSEDLYIQIYKKIKSSRSEKLDNLIEEFARNSKVQLNIKKIEERAKQNNIFDIKSHIVKYFDQVLITDILNNRDIRKESIDGWVTYLRFSDGTNVSAKVKGENYRATIYTSETYRALRDTIKNSNKVSEIKVIWVEDDRYLRVRYNTNSSDYLYMHFYKNFEAKDFEYGYKKYKEYECTTIPQITSMAK